MSLWIENAWLLSIPPWVLLCVIRPAMLDNYFKPWTLSHRIVAFTVFGFLGLIVFTNLLSRLLWQMAWFDTDYMVLATVPLLCYSWARVLYLFTSSKRPKAGDTAR